MNPVISREYVEKNYIPRKKIEEELREIKRMRETSLTAESFNILNGECVVLERILGKENDSNK